MNRNEILACIQGPVEPGWHRWNQPMWQFESDRPMGHRLGKVTARKFRLVFDPETRGFEAFGLRRVSKRKKRVKVKISAGLTAYLRQRLPPEAIATCMAAALTKRRTP